MLVAECFGTQLKLAVFIDLTSKQSILRLIEMNTTVEIHFMKTHFRSVGTLTLVDETPIEWLHSGYGETLLFLRLNLFAYGIDDAAQWCIIGSVKTALIDCREKYFQAAPTCFFDYAKSQLGLGVTDPTLANVKLNF
jgi:hypothetical protein